jgi:hypothetical protein
MIDHDRLFKELLETFLPEFLELFFPELWNALDPDSLSFQDKELFTDITSGEKYAADLVIRAQLKYGKIPILIHLEHQARTEPNFPRRMFIYFCRLLEKYAIGIYPIAVLSFDTPQRPDPNTYQVECCGKEVNRFNYEVIQLNRLNWQDYRDSNNAIGCALMAKMQMERGDRPLVKLECLRMLHHLNLNPARTQLISGFIDIYLRLNPEEQALFQAELSTILPQEQEGVMEIVTSWMEQGIEQGLEQGMRQATVSLVERQLNRRCGGISPDLDLAVRELSTPQLEELSEALLDFTNEADLVAWLNERTEG